ncbi:MAG: hypothetical protein M1826_006280 [Phylliscum demangeonii]|nr:MAG: hypothetical protein M1826_006280 [Phylliscum demangeonii]
MTTILPPPSKRQKTAAAALARQQQDVDQTQRNVGSIRVRFRDPATGLPDGPPILIPAADATVENLELLVNTLHGKDESNRISYQFEFVGEDGDEITPGVPVLIESDVLHTLSQNGLEIKDMGLPALNPKPQAVFRVKSVTRSAASMPGHGQHILAAQFSPASSSRVATGSADMTARIWDCDTGTPVHTLKGHIGWVLTVSWSPDNTLIATGSMDKTVRLWDTATGNAIGGPMTGHTKWITSLAWQPYHLQSDGVAKIASASKDSTVRIWNATLRRIEHVLSGHGDTVSCVKWGGTGLIYTASNDKLVKVWNANDGTLKHTLKSHAHWVNHLALSTDFALRTGYYDYTEKVPETAGEKRAKAEARFIKAATIGDEVVEKLVTASDDLTMFLWEPMKSTKPVTRMLGHQKVVNHVTFSPDGKYIASAGFDNQLKLWNARDGKSVMPPSTSILQSMLIAV